MLPIPGLCRISKGGGRVCKGVGSISMGWRSEMNWIKFRAIVTCFMALPSHPFHSFLKMIVSNDANFHMAVQNFPLTRPTFSMISIVL